MLILTPNKQAFSDRNFFFHHNGNYQSKRIQIHVSDELEILQKADD